MAATQGHLFIPLLVATGVATALWLILLAGWIVNTRPGHVDPGIPTMLDLEHESLPPAIVNLLANHWQVENEAMAATLVDLAARGWVGIEETAPGQFQCRVKGTKPAQDLEAYEHQVLQRVEDRASGGTVPLAALNSGPNEAAGWRRRFMAAVVADARSRGLSRPRLSPGARALLSVTALVPAALAYFALISAPVKDQTTSTSHKTNSISGIVILAVTFAILFIVPRLSRFARIFRAERSTPEGIEAAGRWLGFREYLMSDEVFPTLPPAAVAIWGRNLSYGIALGAAAGAARALPFGAEPDREAWSPFTGQWRIVRVRYPKFLLWGKAPWRAIVRGLLLLVVAALIVYGFEFVRRHSSQFSDHQITEGLAIASVVVFAVVVPLFVLYGVLVLWFGLTDAFSSTEITGRVVRLRRYPRRTARNGREQFRHYVAVDDGSHQRVRAFAVDPQTYGRLTEGVNVRLRVTGHLGYVSDLAVVGAGQNPPSVPSVTASDPVPKPPVSPPQGPQVP